MQKRGRHALDFSKISVSPRSVWLVNNRLWTLNIDALMIGNDDRASQTKSDFKLSGNLHLDNQC